jgi:alpha-tubulin suppressor-like RCC1 family protein
MSATAIPVTGLEGAASITVGGGSACALLLGGSVECWGYNVDGELGNGTRFNQITPVPVVGLAGATAVSVGYFSACAVLSTGAVQCWGDNTSGELGIGTATGPDECCMAGCPCSTTPVAVSGLDGATAVSVGGCSGSQSACAVLSGGTVACWGDNASGQLGNGTTKDSPSPVAVTGLSGATAVSVGLCNAVRTSACALLSDGTVQCWGDNTYGQLGDGSRTNSATPVAVAGVTGAVAVSVGFDAACAILSDGTVDCWGDGSFILWANGAPAGIHVCCLGGDFDAGCADLYYCATTPVAIQITGATAVSVGIYSACALLSGGAIQCWGSNQEDELGDGTRDDSPTLVAVQSAGR